MQNQSASAVNAPTQFVSAGGQTYAYRRFGHGTTVPLLLLQHFTGTLDNWDPLVTDALAASHDVILFENAGVGRSSGAVADTVGKMAIHALAFLDAMAIGQCDLLGFSLGGMVAQQMALDRPSVFRRIVLVGTAPRGGEDVMHRNKPSLAAHFGNPDLKGYEILQKIFFTPSTASQAAGASFIERLMQRQTDREPPSGDQVIQAQMAAFREWDQPIGERFQELHRIAQPTLVINGVKDEMIAVHNSYRLSENLPNAVLLTYPDAGHGSLFQYPSAFASQVTAFLASNLTGAPYLV